MRWRNRRNGPAPIFDASNHATVLIILLNQFKLNNSTSIVETDERKPTESGRREFLPEYRRARVDSWESSQSSSGFAWAARNTRDLAARSFVPAAAPATTVALHFCLKQTLRLTSSPSRTLTWSCLSALNVHVTWASGACNDRRCVKWFMAHQRI